MSVFPDALNYMDASQSYGASIVAALSAGQHPIYWLCKRASDYQTIWMMYFDDWFMVSHK